MILAAFDLLPDLAAHSGVLELFGNLPSDLGLNVRGQGSRQKCAPRPVRVLIPGKRSSSAWNSIASFILSGSADSMAYNRNWLDFKRFLDQGRKQFKVFNPRRLIDLEILVVQGKHFFDSLGFCQNDEGSIGKIHGEVAVFLH
jgi:hypothetical protein